MVMWFLPPGSIYVLFTVCSFNLPHPCLSSLPWIICILLNCLFLSASKKHWMRLIFLFPRYIFLSSFWDETAMAILLYFPVTSGLSGSSSALLTKIPFKYQQLRESSFTPLAIFPSKWFQGPIHSALARTRVLDSCYHLVSIKVSNSFSSHMDVIEASASSQLYYFLLHNSFPSVQLGLLLS